ncbi:MAG: GAF domain-containing protein [Anaerolineae bacterium]|nr:GAF domain-containing protein [Anaerolineae bacterium]
MVYNFLKHAAWELTLLFKTISRIGNLLSLAGFILSINSAAELFAKRRQTASQGPDLEARLTAIHQLGHELTLLYDEEAIIHRVLETATRILSLKSIEYASISDSAQELIYRYRLLDDGRLETLNTHFALNTAAACPGVQVALRGQSHYLADASAAGEPQEMIKSEPVRAEFCVPLKIREQVTGILHAKHIRSHSFTPADQRVLQTLAMQAAVALENARLYLETQQRAKELAALNRATRVVASTLDLATVLEKTIVEVRTMLNVEGTAILLYDAQRQDLVFAITDGPYPDTLAGIRLPLSQGVAGWVARSQQPAIVNDVRRDPRFYNGIDAMTDLSTESILAAPILFQDKLVGVFEVINKFEAGFTQHDLALLESLSRSVAIAIENARLYQAEREQFHRLQRSQAQLIQIEKMAALGRLVGSIAHEINNPIQAIQNCMVLLQEEAGGKQRPDKITLFTNIASDELRRIAGIVRRMLEFYEYHETQPGVDNPASIDDFFHIAPEEIQVIDLHELLDSVLQLTQKQLQKQHITVKREWLTKPLLYEGSPDRLKQVFLNLMLNAIDAMHDRLRLLTVTTMIESATDKESPQPVITISFADTGSGIAEQVLPRIFEPMFTTKPHGSGFGLFVCYKIIEAHGGQITVNSRLSVGTTFTILLPLTNSNDVRVSHPPRTDP